MKERSRNPLSAIDRLIPDPYIQLLELARDLGLATKDIELLRQYQLSLTTENRTPKTIKTYSEGLRALIGYATSVEKGLEDIGRQDIESWILLVSKNGHWKPTTINNRLRSIRTFYNWAEDREVFDLQWDNPMRKIKALKEDKYIKEIFRPDQVAVLLRHTGEGFVGLRNQCAIALCYDAMLRSGEMRTLKRENIDLVRGVVKVFGKSRTERTVPLSQYSMRLLHKFTLKYIMRWKIPGPWFMCRKDGVVLTERAISNIFYRIGNRAGKETGQIDAFHLSPHKLRHSGATQYALNGGNPKILQYLLGHADIRTTLNIYVHVQSRDAQEQHEQFTPMKDLRDGMIHYPYLKR